MKKAFTLIELVVAVALLAMVLGFASMIFKVSIEAYRTAGANAEIMQKLRAITDQLNADFKGAIWNPQGKVSFDFGNSDISKSYINGQIVNVRADSIVFFANGDFQSTGQYDCGGTDKTVVGNVACIYYGLANPSISKPEEKILVRRQTILSSDSDLDDLDLDPPGEYCNTQSLSDLIADPFFDADDLIDPNFNPDEPDDLVMYMAKGVDDFTIQYVGAQYDENGDYVDKGKEFNDWRPENDEADDWPPRLSLLALKFTFTLYDSKGIIEKGRRFTHIVYLGD